MLRNRLLLISTVTATMLCSSGNLFSQQSEDVEAIKAMCGCFEITFDYSETFSPDTSYEFFENYHAEALEWAELINDDPNELQIQHILVVGEDYTVKHWRQDWVYQPSNVMQYEMDSKWKFNPIQPKKSEGVWEQRVFQVDDSPRYGGIGSWVHVDGKHYWESTSPAPLPRREYTKRSDYDVLVRQNRHEILAEGWMHEQDNKKLALGDNLSAIIVAEEKGKNIYTRVSKKRCQAARKYWKENTEFWSGVRDSWDDIIPQSGSLSLHPKVDGKTLYSRLFELPESGVNELIHQYVNTNQP